VLLKLVVLVVRFIANHIREIANRRIQMIYKLC
jgi:hypothetical protein